MALHHTLKKTLKNLAGMRCVSFYDFDMYATYSRGPSKEKTDHAIESTKVIFPLLSRLSKQEMGPYPSVLDVEVFGKDCQDSWGPLGELLDQHGSDKATKHNYHKLLGHILKDRNNISAVLEIGLGTNNPDIASNMTRKGKPGASVRAFRDFLPNAHIYGADFDKRILFKEERISTYFVDQTSPETFDALAENLPNAFDLIIDDGLHSPVANIATLTFALPRLRIGGWMIIEDVNPASIPIWQIATRLIGGTYETHIVQCARNPIIAVKKIG